jgi:hypothetical protein
MTYSQTLLSGLQQESSDGNQSTPHTESANPFVEAMQAGLVSSTENGDFALTSKGMAHRQKSKGMRGGAMVALDQQLVGSRPLMKSVPRPKNTLKPKVSKATAAHMKKRVGKDQGITRKRFRSLFESAIQEATDLEQLAEQLADLIVLGFHVRDIDHGKGERDLFFWYMIEILNIVPETCLEKLIPLIKEYGSYLDYPRLAEICFSDVKAESGSRAKNAKKLYDHLVCFYGESLRACSELPVAERDLSGKWAIRIGSHFDKTCHFGKAVAKYLFPVEAPKGASPEEIGKLMSGTYKRYRQLIVGLTEGMCVETAMCSKEWRSIADNLKKVTGKAQFKYRRAFRDEILCGPQKGERRHPHDPDRTYLREKLEEATARAIEHPEEGVIKGGKTLQAYEIVSKYIAGEKEDPTLEAQWKAIVHELTAPREWANRLSEVLLHLDHETGVPLRTKDTVEAAKYLRKSVLKDLEKRGEEEEYALLNSALSAFKNQTSLTDSRSELIGLVQKWVKQGKAFDGDVSIIDTSGSMSGTPMEVAIALGILVAECQSEDSPWKKHCITFSSDPVWHVMNATTLHGKVNGLKSENRWGMNTNYAKTMNMILKRCVGGKVPQEFLPRRIWCFTDMEFDESQNASGGYYGHHGYRHNHAVASEGKWQTAYVKGQAAFKEAGYESAPAMTFWNIRASGGTTQCQSDDNGVTTYGGFSQAMFKSIIFGKDVDVREETPWDRLKTTLDGTRYIRVREALDESQEGSLKDYSLPVVAEELAPAPPSSDDEWEDVQMS